MADATDFEAFVRRFQDMVFGTAVRLLGDPAEAEDVAQSVFLRAFERFDTIGHDPAAPGWLKTVTRNLCLNHLSRVRGRWQFFSELERHGAADEALSFESSLASTASPLWDLERADLQARLERALHGLPDHQRVPLVLFHFEELGYQQIAALLGSSLAKVKTDIHRGRQALRRSLESDDASR
jgi:RNA polymerase sigma-70 factor (ECF subfamily)